MKIKISSLTFLFLFCFTNTEAGTVKIFISNVDQEKGTIHYAIFNNPEFFPEDQGKMLGGVKNISEVVKTGIVINELQESNYAIAIFHDKNFNNTFDTLLAIPTEKYGFSNNAKVFFGPPKFEEASIFVGENETVEILIELR
jgi:uncharacterized protein (DUF2141 family)